MENIEKMAFYKDFASDKRFLIVDVMYYDLASVWIRGYLRSL